MDDIFTPEQIAQILEEFFKVVGTRRYVGERYVPIFGRKGEESIEWDNSAPYEPLTIVLYQGNSYTSRQYVPIGVEITNQEFWALTGNYNAQIELYHSETIAAREIADNAITTANNAQNDINTLLPKADFSAENTVKKYIDENPTRILTFDTVADMQAATTLKSGMVCHTNGFHAIGDGGAAYYTVGISGTANGMDVLTLQDGLFATLVIINSCVTPEMFGAWGDNSHNDYQAIQYAVNSYNDVMLSNSYYVTQSIQIDADNKNVHGYGHLRSDTDCFVIDGRNHNTISNLRLAPTGHGIVIKSTSRHANFNLVYDVFMYGKNGAGQSGIYIEETGGYITEQCFRNCIMWNFDYGIYATSEGAHQLSELFFEHCDTELTKVAGQYLKNAENVYFNNCRHVESVSLKFITVGVCGLFIYGFAVNTGLSTLSDQTNGMIIGRYRTGGIYNTSTGFVSHIVNGRVIPQEDALNFERISPNASNSLMPSDKGAVINNKFNISSDITIRFDKKFFGGRGKINNIYFRLVASHTFTFEWGDAETVTRTQVIGPYANNHQFHLYWTGSNEPTGPWFIEEMRTSFRES